MINPAINDLKRNYNLSNILEPVKYEMTSLEKKLLSDFTGNNKVLNQICKHIFASGGKRLRPAVTFLISKALNNGFVGSNHFHIGIAVEMIHTATLIHDDVIDDTDIRRNNQTVHKKWNEKTAIIAGDILLARALKRLTAVKNSNVIDIFADIMDEICSGELEQGDQLNKIISFDDYIQKSKRKTAMLFVGGCKGVAISTPGSNNEMVQKIVDFALNFGIAFQIHDDILNFTENEQTAGKPAGTDFKQGIFTAPVLFALEEYKNKGSYELKNLITKGFNDENNYKKALNLVFKSNGINKSYELAGLYINKAVQSIDFLEESIYKKSLVDLAFYIINRNS